MELLRPLFFTGQSELPQTSDRSARCPALVYVGGVTVAGGRGSCPSESFGVREEFLENRAANLSTSALLGSHPLILRSFEADLSSPVRRENAPQGKDVVPS
jgi:hypothetical protein